MLSTLNFWYNFKSPVKSVCNADMAAVQQSPVNNAVYKECLPNRKKPAPPSMECTTAQATLINSTLTVCMAVFLNLCKTAAR